MVFGLFSRKSTLDDASALPDSKATDQSTRLPTPTPSIASVNHHSPLRFSTVFRGALGGSATSSSLKEFDAATDSVASGGGPNAPPPPVTPTPPPVGSSDIKALYDLVQAIPPKTLHAYTLAHLHPTPPVPSFPLPISTPALALETVPRPPSPDTVGKLAAFFSTLAPPPRLHCVRCHKEFYGVENEDKDKACRVPHDDESALVSRVSGGGGYETLWGCCGQTTPGDGSEGPPDGWCYEGRHTTDVKRARFRADSTIHEDRLTSCLKLNCRGVRDQLPRGREAHPSPFATSSTRKSNASPTRSLASVSRPARKRPRKSLKEGSGSEHGEADRESVVGGHAGKVKKTKTSSAEDKDAEMATDGDVPSKSTAKPKSRPAARARPPTSSSTTVSVPAAAPAGPTPSTTATPAKAKMTPVKPKSTSRTLLSQSHTHLASDSDASTRSRPRTRSLVRETSRTRAPASKLTRTESAAERTRRGRKSNKQLTTSEEEPEVETGDQESDREERGRERKKRRVRRD